MLRGALLITSINGQIAVLSWRVWVLLYNGGPHTLRQLKTKLKAPDDLLRFSLGWLAREDKIEIMRSQKSLQVQLWKAVAWPAGREQRRRRSGTRAGPLSR